MRRAGTLLLLVSLAIAAGSAAARAGQSAGQKTARTARDGVFAKAQADRGAATYARVCASCHDPAKMQAAKDPGPPLVGDKFKDEWETRMLGELLSVTLLTMPNDGSAVLSERETADVIAYILQANGYPDGPADLKYDAGQDIVIVK